MAESKEYDSFKVDMDKNKDIGDALEEIDGLLRKWLEMEMGKKLSVAAGTALRGLLDAQKEYVQVLKKELRAWRKRATDEEGLVQRSVGVAIKKVMEEGERQRGEMMGVMVKVQEEKLRGINERIEMNMERMSKEGDKLSDAARRFSEEMERGYESMKGIPRLTGVDEEIRPMGVRMIVTAEGKSVEEVKEKLKSMIKPEDIGVGVKAVVKMRKGLLVELDGEQGKEEFVLKSIEGGLKVVRDEGLRPMVIIRGMDGRMKDGEFKEKVRKGNFGDLSKEEFEDKFEVVHRQKRKGLGNREEVNVLVRCEGSLRTKLIRKGRINVGWEHLIVGDYIDVPRCYKCQGYGHIGKHCGNENACAKCGMGHDRDECREERTGRRTCVNCKREGKEADHDVGWWGCPVYKKAVARYMNKVNYGTGEGLEK